ncbi:type II secretion system protein GspI [Pseudidiomarina planktonica]|nr:type II secretion system protein GspI [Pseudidiomarina planktonica]
MSDAITALAVFNTPPDVKHQATCANVSGFDVACGFTAGAISNPPIPPDTTTALAVFNTPPDVKHQATGERRTLGFTLIEVMLALSIFGLAALAGVKAATDNLNSVGFIQDKTFARYVAANRLAELSLSTRWPPANNQTGSERNGDKEWFWQQQVQETAMSDFRAVTIRVSDRQFTEEDDSSVYSLTRYVGRR